MLHPLHPTPVTGPSARRRRQECPGLPSARKIATWRLRAVTKVTVGNMSNCRFGRGRARRRPSVFLRHGWPYDIHSYVEVARLLAAEGYGVRRAAAARRVLTWLRRPRSQPQFSSALGPGSHMNSRLLTSEAGDNGRTSGAGESHRLRPAESRAIRRLSRGATQPTGVQREPVPRLLNGPRTNRFAGPPCRSSPVQRPGPTRVAGSLIRWGTVEEKEWVP
jgi:hypothetical protein